ncbi:hypothetical protein K432DRAFT_305313 [Lepidopterella palustris CBS 459.81]|uniref:Uncharacterized protein n=1 Tax=Lepidopterella palustris CBS 459.81 TaxID=1314670 RepID=A0A8E2E435_9PEZI|nr:hypothetical protein K432DRAFT_305313 [Lepidopterella palustris CBS 459.81]
MLPLSSSCLTTASCPFSAAHDSGVLPYESFESGSTLGLSDSNLIISINPNHAA